MLLAHSFPSQQQFGSHSGAVQGHLVLVASSLNTEDTRRPGLRTQNKELHLLLLLLYFICINKREGFAKQELFKSKQTKL